MVSTETVNIGKPLTATMLTPFSARKLWWARSQTWTHCSPSCLLVYLQMRVFTLITKWAGLYTPVFLRIVAVQEPCPAVCIFFPINKNCFMGREIELLLLYCCFILLLMYLWPVQPVTKIKIINWAKFYTLDLSEWYYWFYDSTSASTRSRFHLVLALKNT